MHNWAAFEYRNTTNIGDEIQTIAALQFTPAPTYRVDRDFLSQFTPTEGEEIAVIANGWFGHRMENFIFQPAVTPLLISMHFSNFAGFGQLGVSGIEAIRQPSMVEYLNRWGPVGARDMATYQMLKGLGVEAYFSGCLTLTLQRSPSIERQDYILCVDVPDECVAFIRQRTQRRIVLQTVVNTRDTSTAARFERAQEQLELYQGAHCTITTRLHCALPSLAYDVPVLLLDEAEDKERFSGLINLVRHCDKATFMAGMSGFDFDSPQANSLDYLGIRNDLVSTVRSFVADPGSYHASRHVSGDAHYNTLWSLYRTLKESRARETGELVARAGTAEQQFESLVKESSATAAVQEAEANSLRAEILRRTLELQDVREGAARSTEELTMIRVAYEAILQSTSWRLTAPLRYLGNSFPWLRRPLRRLAKLTWWTISLQLPRRLADRRAASSQSIKAAPEPLEYGGPERAAGQIAQLHVPSGGTTLASIPDLTIVVPTINSSAYIDLILNFYKRELGVAVTVFHDSKSTDDSLEVATIHASKVISVQNGGSVIEGSVEFMSRQCGTSWVLRIDDDELPTVAMMNFVRDAIQADTADAYSFPRYQCAISSDGSLLAHVSHDAVAHRQWRLYRADRVIFSSTLHTPGFLLDGIRLADAPIEAAMIHLDWAVHTYVQRANKVERYDLHTPNQGSIWRTYYLYEEEADRVNRLRRMYMREFDSTARALVKRFPSLAVDVSRDVQKDAGVNAQALNTASVASSTMATDPMVRLIEQVRTSKLTYLEEAALAGLADAVYSIEKRGVSGDILELGCALGGSAIVLASARSAGRPVRLYDVFDLIPPPSMLDGPDVHQRYAEIVQGHSKGIDGDTYYGYQDDLMAVVHNNLRQFGVEERGGVELVKGLFDETLWPKGPVALAHIDCDWYEAVTTCLWRLDKWLSPGGILIIDDYLAWSGCRLAVDQFFGVRGDAYEWQMNSRLWLVKK